MDRQERRIASLVESRKFEGLLLLVGVILLLLLIFLTNKSSAAPIPPVTPVVPSPSVSVPATVTVTGPVSVPTYPKVVWIGIERATMVSANTSQNLGAFTTAITGGYPGNPGNPVSYPNTWYLDQNVPLPPEFGNNFYTALTVPETLVPSLIGSGSGSYIVFTDGAWPSTETRMLALRVYYEAAGTNPAPNMTSTFDVVRIPWPSAGPANLSDTAPAPAIVEEYPAFSSSFPKAGATAGVLDVGEIVFATPLPYQENTVTQFWLLINQIDQQFKYKIFGVSMIFE